MQHSGGEVLTASFAAASRCKSGIAISSFDVDLLLIGPSSLHSSTGGNSQSSICLNDREQLTVDAWCARPIRATDLYSVCRAVTNGARERSLAQDMLEAGTALCIIARGRPGF